MDGSCGRPPTAPAPQQRCPPSRGDCTVLYSASTSGKRGLPTGCSHPPPPLLPPPDQRPHARLSTPPPLVRAGQPSAGVDRRGALCAGGGARGRTKGGGGVCKHARICTPTPSPSPPRTLPPFRRPAAGRRRRAVPPPQPHPPSPSKVPPNPLSPPLLQHRVGRRGGTRKAVLLPPGGGPARRRHPPPPCQWSPPRASAPSDPRQCNTIAIHPYRIYLYPDTHTYCPVPTVRPSGSTGSS